jgi:hypothetical protein
MLLQTFPCVRTTWGRYNLLHCCKIKNKRGKKIEWGRGPLSQLRIGTMGRFFWIK